MRKINHPIRSRCRFTVRGDFHAIETALGRYRCSQRSISTDDSTYSLFVYLYNKFRCTSVCSKLARVNVTFLREKLSIGLRGNEEKFSDAIDEEIWRRRGSGAVNVIGKRYSESRWKFCDSCVAGNLK